MEILVYCILSDKALYVVEHVVNTQLVPLPTGKPHPLGNYFRLRRRIPLNMIQGFGMSTLADTFLVIHCITRPQLKPVPWMDDASADKCTLCPTQFGFFTRKHHCRQCGRILCNMCAPEGLESMPDRGVFEKVRMCYPCVGLEPCDLWSDVVLKGFRKTELMALMSDACRKMGTTVNLTFENTISLQSQKYNESTKIVDPVKASLTFQEHSSTPEDSGGRIIPAKSNTAVSTDIVISSPPGVPKEVMAACKKRETRRFQERQRLKEEEQALRATLEIQRQAQRETDRKERIALKKERKAAEKMAKAEVDQILATKTALVQAKKAGSKPPPVAAKIKAAPCGSCACDDYVAHPFKKLTCGNCFHVH